GDRPRECRGGAARGRFRRGAAVPGGGRRMSIAMLVALGIEAVLGWPGALYRRCGHPVTWLGALIAALDRRWNCGGRRRLKGAAAAALVIGLAGAAGALVQAVLPAG